MRLNIEKRLHRVKIELDKSTVLCKFSNSCDLAENCKRCNEFFSKCVKFKQFSIDSTSI